MRRHALAAVASTSDLITSGSKVAELLVCPRDELRLRQVSAPVAEEEFGGEELWALAELLSDTMHAHNGLGLAAIQIGVAKRVLVVSAAIFRRQGFAEGLGLHESVAFCNPEIIETGRETERGSEGCLSFPGAYAMTAAPTRIVMRARMPGGEHLGGPLVGLSARCFWHELQHLDGKLVTDRLGTMERRAFLKAVKR